METATATSEAVTFERLNEIADVIAAAEEPFTRAWATVHQDSTLTAVERLQSSALALNKVIDPLIGEIARVTQNSEQTLRMVYAPKNGCETWFCRTSSPSEFLRNVARFKSFNEAYWASQESSQAEIKLKEQVSQDLEGRSWKEIKPLNPEAAAKEIDGGGVPFVAAKDVEALYKHLEKLGVVEPYMNKGQHWGHRPYAANKHFACVIVKDQETAVFSFCPKSMAVARAHQTSIAEVTSALNPRRESPRT